ncbi:hypothetical protein D3C75_1389370 [compost metagenome]
MAMLVTQKGQLLLIFHALRRHFQLQVMGHGSNGRYNCRIVAIHHHLVDERTVDFEPVNWQIL